MGTTSIPFNNDFDWEMECDLASIASQAAIELDNLVIGDKTELSASGRLAQFLSHSINVETPNSPESQLNPTTAVAVNLAIADAHGQTQFTELWDLLKEVGRLTDVLSQAGEIKEQDELVMLRDFCLALSKRAFALERATQDVKPEHPFRR